MLVNVMVFGSNFIRIKQHMHSHSALLLGNECFVTLRPLGYCQVQKKGTRYAYQPNLAVSGRVRL